LKHSLLDTDILSYVLSSGHDDVKSNARQYLRIFRRYTISTVTVAEIIRGLEKIQNHLAISKFEADCREFEVLPIETPVAILTGQIMGQLDRKGKPIGFQDCLIASTAIVHGLVVVTNNLRHYQRIADEGFSLQIENWRTDTP
jgi:tRNA(fMet)-specific endonuclease VapC